MLPFAEHCRGLLLTITLLLGMGLLQLGYAQDQSAPDIQLSNTSVAENAEPGLAVARISWHGDPDNAPSSYELIDEKPYAFVLMGRILKVANPEILDYEQSKFRDIEIQANFEDGSTQTQSFRITITDQNEPPTALQLDHKQLAENVPWGTMVGTFTVVDPDNADHHELEISGPSPFVIDGFRLLVRDSAAIDYEEHPTIPITVRVTDGGGNELEKDLEIRLEDRNDPPTAIELSNQKVEENSPAGTTVGTLSVADQDSADTHKLEMLDDGNGRFQLQGERITVAQHAFLNYEGQREIPITLRATDEAGLSVEQRYTIHLKNVNEAPSLSHINNFAILEDHPSPEITVQLEDPETRAEYLQVELISSDPDLINPRRSSWEGSGALRHLVLRPEENANGTATLTLNVSDGRLSSSETFRVRVIPVNDAPFFAKPPHATLDEGADIVLDEQRLPLSDIDNRPGELQYTLDSQPEHGSLYLDSLKLDCGSHFSQRAVEKGRLTYRHDGSETRGDTLTLSVRDVAGAGPDNFEVPIKITPVNDPPEISSIPDQSIKEDASTPLIPFEISDAETAGVHLKLSAHAEDPNLLPDSAITIGGIDRMRTLRLRPAPNQFGKTTVHVTVSDGQRSAEQQFTLAVAPINDAPDLDLPQKIVTDEDVPADSAWIRLRDEETEFAALDIRMESQNENLLRSEDIKVKQYGGKKALRLTPQPNRYGKSEVHISVSDGQAEVSGSLLFVVKPVNDAPSTVELYNADARLENDSLQVEFDWDRATDVEDDKLEYQLSIQGTNIDTLIKGIKDPHYVWHAGRRLKSNTNYKWTVQVTDGDKTTESDQQKEFLTPDLPDLPQQYALTQNYPNPFNPVTSITYRLPVASRVRLIVYDMSGRAIARLVNKTQSAGNYTVQWDAGDRASGVYVYRLIATALADQRQHTETRKMMLVK